MATFSGAVRRTLSASILAFACVTAAHAQK